MLVWNKTDKTKINCLKTSECCVAHRRWRSPEDAVSEELSAAIGRYFEVMWEAEEVTNYSLYQFTFKMSLVTWSLLRNWW